MALHTYTPYEWKNAPDHKTTPLSADNLNHIEQGIKNAEDDVASVAADLTSISQTGSTASQAISAGTYFYLDGTLVRAKTAIANGATFTLNTNYEEVSAGALNKLKDMITPNYSAYVLLNSTIANNSSYTAPANGLYILGVKAGAWYVDSARTKVLLGNSNDGFTNNAVALKEGETLYTRNKSDAIHMVIGYIPI